ncbi:MAG: hypothetical protein ABL998_09275 [Planctomycetota bacterium]
MKRMQVNERRAGSTLVVVALLMAAVAMLSLSFLTVLRGSQNESNGSRESLAALYASEAGVALAIDELREGGDGTIESQSIGDQAFWVTASDIGSGRTSLMAYGRDDGSEVGIEVVVQQTPQGFFRWAAFGEENLHMDSNARTDSYDSNLGDYASQAVNGSGSNQYANTDGDVGSNGDISMDSNIGVYGDASPGPGESVTGDLANITGTTTPMATPITLPEIVVPSIGLTAATKSFNTESLPSGNYNYGSMTVNNGKTLTITGPATLVVNNFTLKANSNLLINASAGPVEFFVIDDFKLNSNTTIHSSTYDPSHIEFNLLSDNILDPGIDVTFDDDLVDFDSGSSMYATIYAPSAQVTIDSNFELFGSMVARRVDLNSNCRIHYDERLATLSEGGDPVYETLCWRLVAKP